jgi:hypothetical protein
MDAVVGPVQCAAFPAQLLLLLHASMNPSLVVSLSVLVDAYRTNYHTVCSCEFSKPMLLLLLLQLFCRCFHNSCPHGNHQQILVLVNN